MRANITSAWLCTLAGVAAELWVVDGAGDDEASFVAELLHAPIAATATSAATPVTTVLVLFTAHPFRGGPINSFHYSGFPHSIGLL